MRLAAMMPMSISTMAIVRGMVLAPGRRSGVREGFLWGRAVGEGKDGRKGRVLALRIARSSGIGIDHEYEPGDCASCMTEVRSSSYQQPPRFANTASGSTSNDNDSHDAQQYQPHKPRNLRRRMPHPTERRQRRRNHKHTGKNIRRRRAEAKYLQLNTTPSLMLPPRFRHGRAL